jgi:hypothetical protein
MGTFDVECNVIGGGTTGMHPVQTELILFAISILSFIECSRLASVYIQI